jgi:hypothetical protein
MPKTLDGQQGAKRKRPLPLYYSFHQDRALALCRAQYGACPFNCAKDGAINCNWHVTEAHCEPGKKTIILDAHGLYRDSEVAHDE